MVGVSLSPMHNVGIYRTHWAIYQNVLIGKHHEKKIKGHKKHIQNAKTSKQTAFGP
jgi:hypothetical protein